MVFVGTLIFEAFSEIAHHRVCVPADLCWTHVCHCLDELGRHSVV